MKHILETVKFLEGFSLLLNGLSETIKNEPKEQKRGFLSMLLGTLGAKRIVNQMNLDLMGFILEIICLIK